MSFLSKALKAPLKLHKKVAKTVVGAHKSVAKAVIKSGALAPGIAGKVLHRAAARRLGGNAGPAKRPAAGPDHSPQHVGGKSGRRMGVGRFY